MKKLLCAVFCIMLLTGLASMSYAGAYTQAAAGGVLTVSGSQNLTFTPSPSVLISATTTATAFAITSANDKSDTANGLEYGIISSVGGYFQRTKTTAASSGSLAAPASATGLATSGGSWTAMGGTT